MKSLGYIKSQLSGGLAKKYGIPRHVLNVMQTIADKGEESFVVGGAVRNLLIGMPVSDWDLATSATPDQLMQWFERCVPTGIDHGTVTLVTNEGNIEATTYRRDGTYQDHRHPEAVTFVRCLEEDLARRDFTFNAMALAMDSQTLVDLHGGANDLNRKIVRAVGDASQRFQEDALRMLRAVRFASQLGFQMDQQTFVEICRHAKDLSHIAGERIRDELFKLLASQQPGHGLQLLQRAHLLEYVLPKFVQHLSTGEQQKMIAVCAAMVQYSPSPLVRLAVMCQTNPEWLTDSKKLRLSNQQQKWLQRYFQRQQLDWLNLESMTDIDVRKWIAVDGVDLVQTIIDGQRALVSVENEAGQSLKKLLEFKVRVQNELDRYSCFEIGSLAINGDDVLKVKQLTSGERVGNILQACLQLVLEKPERNHRDFLLTWLKNDSDHVK